MNDYINDKNVKMELNIMRDNWRVDISVTDETIGNPLKKQEEPQKKCPLFHFLYMEHWGVSNTKSYFDYILSSLAAHILLDNFFL